MGPLRANRWVLSFADLCLLLLALMALLNINSLSERGIDVNSSERFHEKFRAIKIPANQLFEEQQAMLSAEGRQILQTHDFHDGAIEISIAGRVPASFRMEEWEMAAARLASVGRHIQQNNQKVDIILSGPTLNAEAEFQFITMRQGQSKN